MSQRVAVYKSDVPNDLETCLVRAIITKHVDGSCPWEERAAEIFRDDHGDSTEVVLGKMDCTYFNFATVFEEGQSLFDVLEGHADATGELYHGLFCKGSEEPRAFWRQASYAMKMLYVDELRVAPAARRAGVGTTLMRTAIPMLASGGIVTLVAEPLLEGGAEMQRDMASLTRQLFRFYRRLGFRQIPNLAPGYLWLDPNREFREMADGTINLLMDKPLT